MANIVLASNNPGKVKELQALFTPFQITLIPQSELGVSEIEETGLTFVENALIKAHHAARITGLPTLADDSGLVVAALDGAPGIYSARYAGVKAAPSDNIQQLLTDLAESPEKSRDAYFYCVLIFLAHERDPTPLICEGKWSGSILRTPQGQQGFGYDPLFTYRKIGCRINARDKNKISHRGIAIQLY